MARIKIEITIRCDMTPESLNQNELQKDRGETSVLLQICKFIT